MPAKINAKKPATPTFMDPSLMLWALVSEIYWMSYKLLERRLYDLRVSAPQARALAVLYFAGSPLRPSAMATVLFQETQSITGTMQRLASRGWIDQQPDPSDHRAVQISLTGEGRALAATVVKISNELYGELFGSMLNAAEKRQVETILKKVRARGFKMPETDFKLRRAQQFPIWKD